MSRVERMASLYEKEMTNGKSQLYSREYARLVVLCHKKEDKARLMAEIFEEYVNEGMTIDNARKQTISIVKSGNRKSICIEPPCKRKK